jgi:hypothetical protein
VPLGDPREGGEDFRDGDRFARAEDLHDVCAGATAEPVETTQEMRGAIGHIDVVAQGVERDVHVDGHVVEKTAGDVRDQALRLVHVLAGAVEIGDPRDQRRDIRAILRPVQKQVLLS